MDGRAARGFVAGVAVVAVAALAAFGLVRPARQAPVGGLPSGHPPLASAPPLAAGEAKDLEARLDAAQAALDRQDFMAAFKETQAVLEREPGQPRALTLQAMVRLVMGQPEAAIKMLDEARAKAPDSIAVYAYSAMAYVRLGRVKEAAALIADAKGRFPTQAAVLDKDFANMQAEAQREAPIEPWGEGNPHDRLAPVPEPPAPEDLKLVDEARTIAGRLEVDAALRAALPAKLVIFVTLREASARGGPPLAAKRMEATGFPVFFEIGQGDSMTGERIPGRVVVEARIDADGDPATRSPQDPQARQADVALGTTTLRLNLRRP